jgi:hypothetical protein
MPMLGLVPVFRFVSQAVARYPKVAEEQELHDVMLNVCAEPGVRASADTVSRSLK